MNPALRAAAARRGGVFTRAEAQAAGYSPDEVRARLRRGAWRRARRGVYAEAGDRSEDHAVRVAAALARLAAGAAASHRSAALLHRLPLLYGAPAAVEVTRAGAPGRRRDGIWLSGRPLPASDQTVVSGVRATTAPRTAYDLACRPGFDEAVLVCDAVLRADPTAAAGLLERAAEGFGPGSGRARRVVAFADGAAESPGESLSRIRIMSARLPAPVLQAWLGDRDEAIGRVDFCWPEQRTVGEFDGRVKYGSPADVRAEKLREDRLRDAGFEVVRWTWSEAFGDFSPVVGRLLRAFARGRRRPAALQPVL